MKELTKLLMELRNTHVKSLRFPVFLELKEAGQMPNN